MNAPTKMTTLTHLKSIIGISPFMAVIVILLNVESITNLLIPGIILLIKRLLIIDNVDGHENQ